MSRHCFSIFSVEFYSYFMTVDNWKWESESVNVNQLVAASMYE